MRRALLLSAALLLAACGGGEDEKAAYVERASAVCEQAVADFDALAAPTTPDGFAPYADSLVEILERTEAELKALTPPEEDQAQLEDKMIDPLSQLVEEGRQFTAKVRAAGGNQVKLLTLLSQRPSAAGIDQEFLRSYGLEHCADAVVKAS